MTTPLAQMSSLQGSTFQKQKEFNISSLQDKLIVLSCAVREETQPDLFGNDCPVPNRSDSTTEHTDDTTDYTNCTKEYTDNTTEHTDKNNDRNSCILERSFHLKNGIDCAAECHLLGSQLI